MAAPDPQSGSAPGPGRAGSVAALRAMPRGIWVLGLVSLFMDISSEMIHALLPLFLTSVLGATASAVGWIEGAAEATASITKIFSGTLSDHVGKRKALAALGYGLGALAKPLFALAPSIGWVVSARFLDRVGKGIRGAPRDALVAELAPGPLRGAAFGLRQSLDTAGAFSGPLLAALLMAGTGNAFRLVFWLAVPPALISVALIAFGVSDPAGAAPAARRGAPIRSEQLRGLGAAYWWLTATAALLTLARFSEAFLILRASDLGLPLALAPLVLVAMNAAYSASAYPVGVLSDRLGRRGMLAAGFAVLALAQLALAAAQGHAWLAAGVLLWGLHMGMTQGLFAALIADVAPAALRGTAFGMFNTVAGVALLLGNAGAGWLWDRAGPAATFIAGAALTVVATTALLASGPLRRAAHAP